MTDKQIIIDGVDVSGCPYYIDSEDGCSSHDCECIKCVHNECFYKDYKRKEQECERSKKNYFTVIQQRNVAEQQLDQLKQSLRNIKELIQKEIDDCFNCDDCISCGYNCCLRQAMQICNEVISE